MVQVRQKCDFCNEEAIYDTQTVYGPWAFVCQKHFDTYATKKPGSYTKLKAKVIAEKTCYICGETKSISEFYKYTDAKGVVRYRNECKKCNLAERKKASFRKK